MNAIFPVVDRYFSTFSLGILLIALMILLVIWDIVKRTDYQKTNFVCRFFGFSIETKSKPHRRLRLPKKETPSVKGTRG